MEKMSSNTFDMLLFLLHNSETQINSIDDFYQKNCCY